MSVVCSVALHSLFLERGPVVCSVACFVNELTPFFSCGLMVFKGVCLMTAKEWLSRATTVEQEIRLLMQERRSIFEKCSFITSRLNTMRVTSTKDPHKYDALVMYEEELDKRIDELCTVRREVHCFITGIEDPIHRELLYRRYIKGQKFEQIALDMHYCYRQVIRIHGNVLNKMSLHVIPSGCIMELVESG